MVKPVNKHIFPAHLEPKPKKKPAKEIDLRVKKAAEKLAADQALTAEKISYGTRLRKIEVQKAAVRAQKKSFLAQRAHMSQQAAAARRARAAEKAKKAAERAARAARKAASHRRTTRIRSYLSKPLEKKSLRKYLPSKKKKKS